MRNFAIAVAMLAVAAAVPLVVGAQEGGNEADGWETRLVFCATSRTAWSWSICP